MRSLVVALTLFTVVGCGSSDIQVAKRVSGVVTLNGKPLANASVTFVPAATSDNQNAGPTAQGLTNVQGKYELAVDPSTTGAVVGQCRVYITTLIGQPGADDRDAGGPVAKMQELIPARYNMNTQLTFNVPAEGTESANFELKSP